MDRRASSSSSWRSRRTRRSRSRRRCGRWRTRPLASSATLLLAAEVAAALLVSAFVRTAALLATVGQRRRRCRPAAQQPLAPTHRDGVVVGRGGCGRRFDGVRGRGRRILHEERPLTEERCLLRVEPHLLRARRLASPTRCAISQAAIHVVVVVVVVALDGCQDVEPGSRRSDGPRGGGGV